MERKSSVNPTLQKQTLVDVCKVDVLKDVAKFTGKHLYRGLYLMKLQASILELHCKRDSDKDVFLWILWIFDNTFFLFNSSGKGHTSMSRYCNKDIKVISVRQYWWLYVSFETGSEYFENHHLRKTYQNLGNLQRKYLWRSFIIVKKFSLVILLMILILMILWNFILNFNWDSDLFSVQIVHAVCILIDVSPKLL